MMQESSTLVRDLLSAGAALAGIADIRELPAHNRGNMDSAISIAVALDPAIVAGIGGGPTPEYFREYEEANRRLDELGRTAYRMLEERGYAAAALAATSAGIDENSLSTLLPHKTAAVLAGLGWIGKCALLVTKQYGSAVRLTTVLTDMPADGPSPMTASLCGNCRRCAAACPGGAVRGRNWEPGMVREDLYDARACRKAAYEQARAIGVNNTICGVCIAVCPWTRRYVYSA